MSSGDRFKAGSTDRLLVARAAGMSVQDAAAAAGMSVSSAQRRLAVPEVRARLDQLRSEQWERGADALTALVPKAAVKLGEMLDDPDTPPSVRAKCIDIALSRAVPLRDSAHLDRRLAELESERRGEVA